MSTVFGATPTLSLSLPGARRVALHQRNSWYFVVSAWRFIASCSERRSQRLSLRDLIQAPHLLNDIGLTRDQALQETAKPFWRG